MITVEIKGEIIQRLKKGDGIVVDALEKGVKEAAALTDQLIIDESPKATGSLMKSVTKRVTGLMAEVFPTVPHANYVHFGTRPHGIPSAEMKPGGTLYRWAVNKGLNPYAVVKSIAKRGIKPNPFMDRALARAEKDVPKIFDDVCKNIVEKMT